jgi:Phosphodiester glycosidase
VIRLARFALFLLLSTRGAIAEWRVSRSVDGPSTQATVVHRHVDLEESRTGEQATLDLALFSTKACRLRVIDNSDGVSLASIVQHSESLAAVNGGYFDPDFGPLGLRIVDGKTTSRLTRGRLLTGVVASDNVVRLFRIGEFDSRSKWKSAVESGPFLVDFARPVRGLESTRSARRTFTATETGDRAALGFSSEATLAELGHILVTPLGDFKIQRALNFDGGSSSAFWFKRANGSAFSISEQKPVRDFVAVVPR